MAGGEFLVLARNWQRSLQKSVCPLEWPTSPQGWILTLETEEPQKVISKKE